jgi:hypothetical protein
MTLILVTPDMRMIPLDDEKCNAKLKRIGNKVFLIATRDIYPNEDIFVAYGAAHWAIQQGLVWKSLYRRSGTITFRNSPHEFVNHQVQQTYARKLIHRLDQEGRQHKD